MTFLFTTLLGRIVLVIAGLVTLTVVIIGVVGLLAVTGGPESCTPGGGPIEVSAAMSDRFQQKWDQFEESLDAGAPASVTFSESEITSRAVNWIDNEDGPDFDDVQVCIHDSVGEATGGLQGWGPFNVKFLIRGTAEIVGDDLFIVIEDVEVGNVPGLLTSVFEGEAEGPIDEGLDDLGLAPHTYTITLTEGSVTVDGQP